MYKKKTKLISVCTALSLVTTGLLTSTTSTASAETNSTGSEFLERMNDLDMVDDNSFIVEYEEDGKDIKLESTWDENNKIYQSVTYEKNENGTYELLRKIETESESAKVKIENADGTKEEINLDEVSLEVHNELASTDEIGTFNYNDLGPWQYHTSNFYRQDIRGMQRDLVISTIIGIAYWPAGAAYAAASILVARGENAFWIDENISIKYTTGPIEMPRGEMIVTNIYADNNKNFHVEGPHYRYNYTPGYEPS